MAAAPTPSPPLSRTMNLSLVTTRYRWSTFFSALRSAAGLIIAGEDDDADVGGASSGVPVLFVLGGGGCGCGEVVGGSGDAEAFEAGLLASPSRTTNAGNNTAPGRLSFEILISSPAEF